MNIGDIVIITESFGSGEDYIGHVGKLTEINEWCDQGSYYLHQVNIEHPNRHLSFICNCIPATDLIKALA